MNKKNAGQSTDEILQNEFTAYFAKAAHRHKNYYMQKTSRLQQREVLTTGDTESEAADEFDLTSGLHIMQQIENEALYRAICDMRENGAAILFMRAIEEQSFIEIAEHLHMSESAVKAIYYRLLKKLKMTMCVDNREDMAE